MEVHVISPSRDDVSVFLMEASAHAAILHKRIGYVKRGPYGVY